MTDCRLSSASAAIKFSEGNSNLIRRILVNNCAIFDTNRGLTLQIATGGTIRDVVISNLTMDLHRFDWFWAGDGNAFNLETKRSFRITTRVTVNWPPRGLTPELQRECGVIWER